MKNKKLAVRVLSLIAALAILAMGLCSCGSTASKTSLTVGSITADAEKNGLDGQDLKKIADLAASTYSDKFDSREMLVAAYRGYDMTAADFADNSSDDLGINLDAFKNVIAKMEEQSKETLGVDLANLNEADATAIIESFQVNVTLTSESGVLDKILCGIGAALNWLTNTLGFGYYLIGICIFAIIIEILMLPFAIKQQKNSIRQSKLRPKEMAIKAKYKGRNDKVTMQKMQQEIQELYQKENYSPYSGCLPLLIQLPIIMALYYIVIDPLHYVLGQASTLSTNLATYMNAAKAAGGLGMNVANNAKNSIALLSTIRENGIGALEGLKDFLYFSNSGDMFNAVDSVAGKIPNFNVGSLNLGVNPSFGNLANGGWILLFVPVLTFVTYFFTMRLSRKFTYQPAVNEGVDAKQAACSNTMMDVTMPAMSTWFTFMVPALVGVYWIFRSIIGFAKTVIMSKVMPLPTFSEEDYKAAAKELAGKKEVVKSQNAGRVRSLHHIDDEDYDDTREAALKRKALMEEAQKEEDEKKASSPFGGAILKKDRKNEKNDK